MKDVERIERENDVETLRTLALLLARENARLVKRMLELQKELAAAQGKEKFQLELELANLEKELAKVGSSLGASGNPKSEKRDHEPASNGEKEKQKQPGHGPKAQLQLPVVEEKWTLEAADKTCPSCGNELAEWAGESDDSEEIDVVERQFKIVKHRRQKYRCKCGHCETALGPKRWLKGGRYSAAFAIMVATAKYLDHMPLERQVRQMGREGLDVDSNTLFDQLWALANIVRPAYDRLPELQKSQLVLHVDETRWPMLDGKSEASWHMWDVVSEKAAYYSIRDGRGGVHAEALLSDFEGYVMSDGYAVYASLAKRFPKIKHLACLVHARRKFVECSSPFPDETERILKLIGELYAIEAEATSLENRRVLRETRSAPLVAELHKTLVEMAPMPGSALEAAVRYVGKRWSKLTYFLQDPRLPLDNNAAERALRGPVVGRKNHHGSKSRRGTEVAAIFYSLLETAKLQGINPAQYLAKCVEAHLAGETIPLPLADA